MDERKQQGSTTKEASQKTRRDERQTAKRESRDASASYARTSTPFDGIFTAVHVRHPRLRACAAIPRHRVQNARWLQQRHRHRIQSNHGTAEGRLARSYIFCVRLKSIIHMPDVLSSESLSGRPLSSFSTCGNFRIAAIQGAVLDRGLFLCADFRPRILSRCRGETGNWGGERGKGRR